MTRSRLKALSTLATAMMLLTLLSVPAHAAPDRMDPVAAERFAAGGTPDAGPDAGGADLDAPGPVVDAEINDPAPANSDCQVAPGAHSRRPLSALFMFACALFIGCRRRV